MILMYGFSTKSFDIILSSSTWPTAAYKVRIFLQLYVFIISDISYLHNFANANL